ncbi:MAG: CD225/dispanin family protein [Muribaculaceae bacterium]|nr:CD225/dispanin family protein [Muribaculaceae bacterium]
MEYYLAINNQQSGPFPADQLVANGMTADTLVWYQGAPNWIKASAVPELAPYLPVEPAPVSQPQPVSQSQPVSFDPQPVSQPQPYDQATMVQQPEPQPQSQPQSFDPQPISQPQSEGQATMIQQPSPYDPQPVSQPQYDPYGQPQANPYSQPSYPQQPQYDPYGQPQINPYSQPSYPQQPQQQYDPYGQPQINGFGQQPQYPQPYGQPQYPQAYGYDPNQVQIPPRPESNMVWAVLSTLCCCLPLGIVAIINASGVNSAYNAGRFEEAQSKADNAKNWAMWAAIVGVVINAIYFFVSMSGGY